MAYLMHTSHHSFHPIKIGKPEPTELPKPKPKNNYVSNGSSGGMGSIHSNGAGGMGGGGAPKAGTDPNGMERLAGETDEAYIARQTRLRDEAKARMAAKFGGGGGMGGVGSGGSRMGGVGSDPNYNPHSSGYGDSLDVSAVTGSVMSGLGTAFGALSTAASSVSAAVQDENTRQQLSSTASSFWGGLSAGASNFVQNVTAPDDAGNDGLADLQRQFHSQSSTKPSKYSGFGSDSMSGMGGGGSSSGMGGSIDLLGGMGGISSAAPIQQPAAPTMPTSTLGEAIPGQGEDPNGVEALTGESDEQYVMRQTRLRNEAKARMAAKFGGGGGMGGVGSGSAAPSYSAAAPTPAAPSSNGFVPPAPSSGNLNVGAVRPKAPSSGNATKVTSGDDFFANFGT